MNNAHGIATHAAARENLRVFVTAFAYALRSICKTVAESVSVVRFVAPA